MCVNHSAVSDSLRPYQAPLSIEFSRQGYWSGLPCPPPGGLPNPGIKPRSPALQADSLPIEPPGKPKNTGVGSLTLLQGIFPAQEWNWGLLHCRQIFYQLSYQRSPMLASCPLLEHKILICWEKLHMNQYVFWITLTPLLSF